jgi:hypothetical protein
MEEKRDNPDIRTDNPDYKEGIVGTENVPVEMRYFIDPLVVSRKPLTSFTQHLFLSDSINISLTLSVIIPINP